MGAPYAWLVRTMATVNQNYCYGVDADSGPFFLTFCSCFPYDAKLCVNEPGYLKRQPANEGIAFEVLDDGVRPARIPPGCGLSRTN